MNLLRNLCLATAISAVLGWTLMTLLLLFVIASLSPEQLFRRIYFTHEEPRHVG
jgi:hypothetical protein